MHGGDPLLLERLLEDLALEVDAFATCVVSSGWRLRMAQRPSVTLHFVLRGDGELQVGGDPPVPLGPYHLALVPQGRRSSIQRGRPVEHDAAARPTSTDGPGTPRFVAGPDGDRELVVACGRLHARYAAGLGLFDLMHDPVVLDFSDSPEMQATFERLLRESVEAAPGSRAMTTALMNECLVLVLRRLCVDGECQLPWLVALEDRRMARVVDAVLADPAAPHTVASLAATAAMSRSAFAAAFAEGFGRPPMEFVREVRLRRAAELLRTTDLPVDAVGRRVGYGSRSHFSRAFTGSFGASPRRFRDGHRQAALTG